jgi:two-component system nitrogen regulation response regulator GlnG
MDERSPLDEQYPTTVLLIEDDAAIRELVCSVLDDEGVRVVTATSHTDALMSLITSRFGLILTDTVDASGVGSVDRWADLDRLRSVAGGTPTIIFTAHPPRAFDGYEEHGCIGLISKPFDIDEFTATVSSTLARRTATVACS